MASNWPPKKNVAFTMYYFIHKNDGTIIANPTLTGSNVHVDGNVTQITDSTLAVVDSTTGLCSIVLAQATMNGDQIDGTITASDSGAVVYTFKLMTAANTQDEIVAGTVKAKVDVDTIKTQAVTCGAGVTVLASVGTAATATAQTGDAYAIVNHADYGNAKLVRSTTPANTLDVSATGEAGLDFNNIKDATGAHTLTNITVPTVTTTGTATAVTTVNGIANDAITAASINTGALTADAFAADAIVAATLATGAITADAFAADALVAATFATNCITDDAIATGAIASSAFAAGAIDAAAIAANAIDAATFAADVDAEIAAMVWDAVAANYDDASSMGALLNDAGAAGDPWATPIPGSYEAGSAGVLLGTTIPAAIATIDGNVDDIETAIGALPTTDDITAGILDHTITDHNNADTVGERLNQVELVKTQADKIPASDGTSSWNVTALAAINAEVDTALNTAIPGSPTANSINERIAAIDDLTQASGDGDLAAILTDTSTTLDDKIDAILVDTGTTLDDALATVDTNLDTLITTVGAAGAGLTALAPASTALSSATWTGTKAGYLDMALSDIPTATENADGLLARDLGSGSNAGTLNERTVRSALRAQRNKVTLVDTTLTVKCEDDSTTAWTGTVTTSGSADPITAMDPA